MSKTKKLCFLLLYLLIPLPFIGYMAGGLYVFSIFFVVFICVPLVDFFVHDSRNPSPIEEKALLRDSFFRNITFVYVPIQMVALIAALYMVATQDNIWYEWLGFAMSIGLLTGGIGITLAHELMHKNNPVQQFLSKVLLVMVCYGHFMIEHVRGHHVRVATPDDPASSRLGESVYAFLPRTIIGSFKSAWHLELVRLKQKQWSSYSYHNQFWWIILAPLVIFLICFMLGGVEAALFFLCQAIVAICMLELVNYIEHYGLERRKLPSGHYERVSPCHSWNANHWLSNMILFHLQRHSDHHTYGARPYQILRHMEQSPQLPSGYLGMMFIALFPPVWRAVMDKRVTAYLNNDGPIQATDEFGFDMD